MKAAIDHTGLAQVAAALDGAPIRAIAAMTGIVTKGAVNIKTEWRRKWSGHPRIKRLPAAIGFDIRATPSFGIEAEIGPDAHSSQGPLAHLIEYGSPRSPGLPAGLPALAAEAPRFEAALLAAGEKATGL